MSQSATTQEARFAAIVAAFHGHPNVTPPAGTTFGSSALKVNTKIFAMLSSRGEFVVKLPRQRVDALVAAEDGERFDMGHGRRMKEWVAINLTAEADWLALAREAMEFVTSLEREGHGPA
ncbi:MAG: hypothetical protein M3Q71_07115 [Chloroflexota bacterium]|nr:hypothetical protein [Chloroflexota bacterium]